MSQTTETSASAEELEDARLPENARHGKARGLSVTWAGVLLAPGSIVIGMVAASGGAGFAVGFSGMLLGIVVGAAVVGYVSIWGPRTGLAAMPLGRLAFGALNFVPQVFLIFSLIAYDALNDLIGVESLSTALGIPFFVALAVVLVIEVTVVIFGIPMMRTLGIAISVVMVVICAWLISAAADAPPAQGSADGSFPMGPFLIAIGLGLSSSLSWCVQATDISRRLHVETRARGVVTWTFLGMAVPLTVMGLIGAWISSSAAMNDPMGTVFTLLGGGTPAAIALVAMGASLATSNALNDFSAGLSLRQLGVPLPRIACSLLITMAGVTVAIFARRAELGTAAEDVVMLAGYYTTPWLGIVLVETWRRKRQQQMWLVTAGQQRSAVLAFVLGFFLLLPFTATPIGDTLAADAPIPFAWLGFISRDYLDGGGLGFVAGILFGAAIYALLRRPLSSDNPGATPAPSRRR